MDFEISKSSSISIFERAHLVIDRMWTFFNNIPSYSHFSEDFLNYLSTSLCMGTRSACIQSNTYISHIIGVNFGHINCRISSMMLNDVISYEDE